MSGITPIRKVTAEDGERVNASAVRFAARHGLGDITGDEYTTEVFNLECKLSRHGDARDRYLSRLWQKCFCRALGFKPDADLTIGWGYIGYRCK